MLYQEYVCRLFRYCVRLVGRPDIAEDIASEVFLTLYQNLDRIQDRPLSPWLFTVARNKALDYWRHEAVACRHRQSQPERPAYSEPALPFETVLLENRSLTAIHRLCLILRYVHGLSRAEIAQQTGLRENQIKGHLQYALRLLRQSFSGASRERDESSLARCSPARAESLAVRHDATGSAQPMVHAISFRSPSRATQTKKGVAL
jgi:RNA polymerase sigma-70 factor (ECF subfamily)